MSKPRLIPRGHGECAQCGTSTTLDEMDFGPYRGQFICDNCYDAEVVTDDEEATNI